MEKQDWHKADIIAALHKKGLSLASLSRANGLSSSTLNRSGFPGEYFA